MEEVHTVVSNAMTIMTSLPTTHINWPAPEELVSAGCDATRLIFKGEMREILIRQDKSFRTWHTKACDSGLKLLLDLPGSRPTIADREHGNNFHEANEVIFVDSATPCIGVPTHEKLVKVRNLADVIGQLSGGDGLSIADGACMFRIFDLRPGYIRTKCEWSSSIELFARGVTFPGVDINYICPTPEELEFLHSVHTSNFGGVIVSFASAATQLSEVRNVMQSLPVTAKIESRRGSENSAEVISSADNILIGRSDLRSDVGSSRLGLEAESIIRRAQAGNKRVLVGSGILESLCYETEPSIADILDLWHIWKLEADGVLIAGSVSVRFPLRAIKACKELLYSFADLKLL
jgi:pyruvate kinase